MKVPMVLGTRPEIIKMAPVIRECKHLALDYSHNMDKVFFDELKLSAPKYHLDVGSPWIVGSFKTARAITRRICGFC